MVVAALIVGLVAALLLAVVAAAMVEVFRQLHDIHQKLEGNALPLKLPSVGMSTRELGLPELERRQESALLFLTPKCSTCLEIAQAMAHDAPDGVLFVIPAGSRSLQLFEELAGAYPDRVLEDGGHITDTLGVNVVPSLVRLRSGIVNDAFGLTAASQVAKLVGEFDELRLPEGLEFTGLSQISVPGADAATPG